MVKLSVKSDLYGKELKHAFVTIGLSIIITACSSSSSPTTSAATTAPSSSATSSSPAAPTTSTSALPAPGSGNGVVNFQNSSNGLTFSQVCLSASGTYDPSHNGNRVPIPSGSPICNSGQIAVGTNFRIGGDTNALFNPGPTSLIINGGAIFAVTINSGTTNLVYPTLQ